MYQPNPFLERMSEHTTSDSDFVKLFSPHVLENLQDAAFRGGVHIFRSAPGAGKTTLLRAFTPPALSAFWRSRQQHVDSVNLLTKFNVIQENVGPCLLGVILSCASGYTDIPSDSGMDNERLFRALLNYRIILRTLRTVGSMLSLSSIEQLSEITLSYDELNSDLAGIPSMTNARELYAWAEDCERKVYAQLDSFVGSTNSDSRQVQQHLRLEGVIWLQNVQFWHLGKLVLGATKKLLMIDDLHKLRQKQRSLLIDELATLRPVLSIWLAERTSALGDQFLSLGVREGREVHEYSLEEMFAEGGFGARFKKHAQNILDRRMLGQHAILAQSFSSCLSDDPPTIELPEVKIQEAIKNLHTQANLFNRGKYKDLVDSAEQKSNKNSIEYVKNIYWTRAFIARDQAISQPSFDFVILPANEFEEKTDAKSLKSIDIFMRQDFGLPYYYGFDDLSAMSTNNIEELLSLAATLYDGLTARSILRKEPVLPPHEQEKLLLEVAKSKHDFIPKSLSRGSQALRLLDSIGKFCKEKTYDTRVSYQNGITGIRLSNSELELLTKNSSDARYLTLRRVLSECAANNLMVPKPSAESGKSRPEGTIFYLNRTLCAYYGLPLQFGGWQELKVKTLLDMM